MRSTPAGRFLAWQRQERQKSASLTKVGAKGESAGAGPSKPRAPTWELMPSHLPPRPAGLFARKKPSSRRRAQRWSHRRASWLLCEAFWSGLAFVASGNPKSVGAYGRALGSWRTSPRHEVAFSFLHLEFLAICRLKPTLALAEGRGIARLHSLHTALLAAVPECESDTRFLNLEGLAASAVPVRVSEVEKRVPQSCGECDPQLFLKSSKRACFRINICFGKLRSHV